MKTELEMIKDIRDAKNNNKLVVFVGSGVSANSGIPTWDSLTEKFARSINYACSNACPLKNTDFCIIDKCDKKYKFTQEEYLKIPEYCYLNNRDEYYHILKSTFRSDAVPNIIHSLIYKLQPHHIITTNFDSLLEKTTEPFSRVFSVIRHDSDLFNSSSFQHYLIKMHGDIEDIIDVNSLGHIVLKEQEFVEYEQTHPLISAFIKSLLIDHTFLFLGYSINDYNLKIIVGWVNYYIRNLNSKTGNGKIARSKYYILSDKHNLYRDFEIKYYNSHNIYLLPIDCLQNINLPKEADSLEDKGKELYRAVESIRVEETDNQNFSALDVLSERYKVLNAYSKIAHEDFLQISKFKYADIVGRTLLFSNLSEYNWVISSLNNRNIKGKYIVDIFRKTGIVQLKYEKQIWRLTETSTLPTEQVYLLPVRKKKSLEERILKLYQNNQYTKIEKILESLSNSRLKQYYLALLNPNNPEFTSTYDIPQISDNSRYNAVTLTELLFQKYSQLTLSLFSLFIHPGELDYHDIIHIKEELLQIIETLTLSQSHVTGYLQGLMRNNSKKLIELESAWNEVKKSYTDPTHIVLESGDSLIRKMQTVVYDYYYYTSLNCLYTTHDSYSKKFYEPYTEAILLSYSPQKSERKNNIFINTLSSHISELIPNWELTETDVDIIVKHSDVEKIRRWLATYNITKLSYAKNVHITTKFKTQIPQILR